MFVAMVLRLTVAVPVLQYHGGPRRSGLYTEPALAPAALASLHRDPAFDGTVEGHVYAQPLYLPGRPGDRLIVATESDVVEALDSRTGLPVWKRKLGEPVPRERLPCGDIDPLGITGTPVASPDGRVVYLDAMVTPDGGRTKRHLVFALSSEDGRTLPGWPIDVGAALRGLGLGFVTAAQNQRSALALSGDTLAVVYGGHFGDCGDYHGVVVTLSVAPPGQVKAWEVPARGGGMWAPGGPAVADASLFVSTGNTFGAERWAFGEAVLRFSLEAFGSRPVDSFAPADWKDLDDSDRDLGGSGPLPFELDGRRLLAAFGKDGDVYLLDRSRLGGIGGELSHLHAATNHGGFRTAGAAFRDGDGETLVLNGRGAGCPQGQSGDLVAVRVESGSPPTLRVAWCADSHGRPPPGGSPIVTSPDGRSGFVVWNTGAEGDDRLHAFDGRTGAVLFDGGGAAEQMGEVRRFQTPLAASGRVFVAGDGRVYAFTPSSPRR
ncbi:MAG TPA: hypothetical protein VMB50_06495 [Myxococcales bacterium]|nr:hypothetical protein [Myxococcales bacterium]